MIKITQIDLFCVSVDYEISIEEAVKKLSSHYDRKSPKITSRNFPTNRKGRVDIALELIQLNRAISTNMVIREIDKSGYRPAEIRELLAFGESYPKVQYECCIAALGSIWKSQYSCYVPYFYRDGLKRNIGIRWIEHEWQKLSQFAVVQK
jgi:hypothetical protein